MPLVIGLSTRKTKNKFLPVWGCLGLLPPASDTTPRLDGLPEGRGFLRIKDMTTKTPQWACEFRGVVRNGLPADHRRAFDADFLRTRDEVTDWSAKYHETMIGLLEVAKPHDISEEQVVSMVIELHKSGAEVSDDERKAAAEATMAAWTAANASGAARDAAEATWAAWAARGDEWVASAARAAARAAGDAAFGQMATAFTGVRYD